MNVKIKYLIPIKKVVGKSEEKFEFRSDIRVTDLLKEMVKKYGEDFENYMVFPESENFTTKKIAIGIQREGMVGTRAIEMLNGFDTPLKDQDRVLLYSPQA